MLERKNVGGVLLAKDDGVYFTRVSWDKRQIAQHDKELSGSGVYTIQTRNSGELQIPTYVGLGDKPVLLEAVRKSQDIKKNDDDGIHWDTCYLITNGSFFGKTNKYLEHTWYRMYESDTRYRMLNKQVPNKGGNPTGSYKSYMDSILRKATIIFDEMEANPQLYGESQPFQLAGRNFYIDKDNMRATGRFVTDNTVILLAGSQIASKNNLKDSLTKDPLRKCMLEYRNGLSLQEDVLIATVLSDTQPTSISCCASISNGQYITRRHDLLKISLWD